ncbi:MAG: pseudouridine synthase [Eggerthellaceae bacterium]|jgi:23S rRNA pseudouridine2605 synthase
MTSEDERIVPMRLQKFLARAGVASRRGSENLMTAGRVTVNGQVVRELGSKVDPRTDVVAVDGKIVSLSDTSTTLMLHKPAQVLTTMSDPFNRPCVADLVPSDLYPGLFPIGRLDFDTTGLLLFSTDGNLGNRLLHPKHHVPKTYLAYTETAPGKAEIKQLERGIELSDGPTQPARIRLLHGEDKAYARRFLVPFEGKTLSPKGAILEIEISEGRKRQVKRMFEAINHPLSALHRKAFGGIELGDLSAGLWRMLTDDELEKLTAQIQL